LYKDIKYNYSEFYVHQLWWLWNDFKPQTSRISILSPALENSRSPMRFFVSSRITFQRNQGGRMWPG